MLCSTIMVTVPAQAEIDADIAEYGELSPKLRGEYGVAAVEAGDPDFEVSDMETSASDAIANILHWISNAEMPGKEQAAVLRVMRLAMQTFEGDKRV